MRERFAEVINCDVIAEFAKVNTMSFKNRLLVFVMPEVEDTLTSAWIGEILEFKVILDKSREELVVITSIMMMLVTEESDKTVEMDAHGVERLPQGF